MQTGDIRLIKDINARLVLNLIREHKVISGADLAKITGMRPSTISNILRELKSKNLIVNLGKGESTDKGGKRPYLWGLNDEASYVLGVDVELGEITAVVLKLNGESVFKHVYKTEQTSDIQVIVDQIVNVVHDSVKKARIDMEHILGLGVAVAGVVNSVRGVVIETDISPKMNIPLKAYLGKHFNFPMVIENNANAAAIGAKWVGSAKDVQNFIIVLVELHCDVGGMGIGLVLDGELYHGANYCSGELNVHLPTLTAILNTLRNRLHEGDILKNYIDRLDELDIYKVIDAAKKGDKVAQMCFSIVGHHIGQNIAPAVGLINPEKLVIAGDISELEELVIEPINKEIEMITLNLVHENLEVTTSIHGRYSVAMGAASLILNEFFKVVLIKKSDIVSL
ncbi:MAG: ROK family transcriptional regulator [Calditrichaeota bacterium]|nr:ROK family transcriptional regulator [Calditrichota bacterium]